MEYIPSILIVDDIPANIQILGNILRQQNYEIEFATSGKDAMDWFEGKVFDMVLLDVMMPGIDGFEVCRKLKSSPHSKSTEVIFITAKYDIESIVKGFDVGAVDYITKPFNKKELVARLNTHLTVIKQRKELEASNSFQNQLISVIGHDLRNNIGSIKTYFEILNETKLYLELDEDIAGMFGELSGLTESTFTLLENLLAWAKNKSGRLIVNPENKKLKAIIDDNLYYLKNLASNKKIELINEVSPDATAFFDENLISTVIRNLLSNAIKFSEENKKIYVREIKTEKTGFISLSVIDEGKGIRKEELIKIFNDTIQFTSQGTKEEKGTGLGLQICKAFIELSHGQLKVNSQIGKGTQVNFTLPLKLA